MLFFRRQYVSRYDVDACHEFGRHFQIARDTLRTERPTVEFAPHDGTHCQVVGMGSSPILNGLQCRHTHVGIEMVGHSSGERDRGFVPIAIDLIEGLIQFRIIAPTWGHCLTSHDTLFLLGARPRSALR